ncbi:MAG: hypothetical protein ACREFF_08695 [Candidatus Udaeobacter sp.]
MFPVIVTRKLKGQQSLHQPGCRLRSPAVIKRIAIPAVLFLAITFLMSACVSHDDDVSERSGLQSAAPVPGEKIPDQGAYAPGPPGSSGSVRW